MITGYCKHCGCQIHLENKCWIDNSGGDVCGVDGDNSPHEDDLDNEFIPLNDRPS